MPARSGGRPVLRFEREETTHTHTHTQPTNDEQSPFKVNVFCGCYCKMCRHGAMAGQGTGQRDAGGLAHYYCELFLVLVRVNLHFECTAAAAGLVMRREC